MNEPSTGDKKDSLIKIYFRIEPEVREGFKAVARSKGQTMEGRLQRLLRRDVARHQGTSPLPG